ncbi:MAG: twin-arginine translocase subunit TatC [Holophagales bacterium]|jgi:sec-independent protein translocase protein TatC|nr:twin-arginine translocase subunit TatC [Holophagales bacterium]
MSDSETKVQQMTFWDHLQELRVRLVRCIIILAAGFAVTFSFRFRIWEWVQKPLIEIYLLQLQKSGAAVPEVFEPFSYTGISEPFFSLLRVAFWTAGFLVAPLIFYQVWAFIRPGLYERERRMVIPFVFVTTICFLGGAIFAYVFAFKLIAGVLIDQAIIAGLRPNLKLDEYLDLFINTLVGTGLIFEMPVLVYFLARFRLITAKWMLKYCRHAALVILVIAAFITPGDIIVATIFLGLIMIGLYFISVLAAWLAEPKSDKG